MNSLLPNLDEPEPKRNRTRMTQTTLIFADSFVFTSLNPGHFAEADYPRSINLCLLYKKFTDYVLRVFGDFALKTRLVRGA